nr:myb-related transcription factor, partner of profilin-like [Procambarus clarkii]
MSVSAGPPPALHVVDVPVDVHVPPPPADVVPASRDVGSSVLESLPPPGPRPDDPVSLDDCSSDDVLPLQKRARRCPGPVSQDVVVHVSDVASVGSPAGVGVDHEDVVMLAAPAKETGGDGTVPVPACVSGVAPLCPPAPPCASSPKWEVVAPAVAPGVDRDLVLVLKKDTGRGVLAPYEPVPRDVPPLVIGGVIVEIPEYMRRPRRSDAGVPPSQDAWDVWHAYCQKYPKASVS